MRVNAACEPTVDTLLDEKKKKKAAKLPAQRPGSRLGRHLTTSYRISRKIRISGARPDYNGRGLAPTGSTLGQSLCESSNSQ